MHWVRGSERTAPRRHHLRVRTWPPGDRPAPTGEHEVVDVVDREFEVGTDTAGCAVLGSDDALAAHAKATCADAFVVAIGNVTRSRVTATARVMCPDLVLLSAVHSTAAKPGARPLVRAPSCRQAWS